MTFDIAIVLILLVAAYGVLPDVRASFDCPQMGTAHRVPGLHVPLHPESEQGLPC
ncbi:hypothetical protein NSPZN2_11365 [Nitrospira defluvii]|uniref:Uncharacterized protein n=1 Tax=Nitrospira defluvii TaxID=330214 RepID=A0ABM8QT68_9BACT|nr:hypothetical protein NSPZN2_11365 [Nitrospira defluvii]